MLTERLSLFNDHLEANEWLAGPFSVADIMLFVAVEFAARSDFQLDSSWKHLQRGYGAVKKRPSADV